MGKVWRAGQAQPWLTYEVDTDALWRVRRAAVRSSDGPSVTLDASDGTWRDAEHGERADLRGCVDIDLQATPFTNTLPIRRLTLAAGGSAAIDVLYLDHATLTPRRVEQVYTCLRPWQSGAGVYRYQSPTFTADLPVDGHGLVRDYPPYWVRID